MAFSAGRILRAAHHQIPSPPAGQIGGSILRGGPNGWFSGSFGPWAEILSSSPPLERRAECSLVRSIAGHFDSSRTANPDQSAECSLAVTLILPGRAWNAPCRRADGSLARSVFDCPAASGSSSLLPEGAAPLSSLKGQANQASTAGIEPGVDSADVHPDLLISTEK